MYRKIKILIVVTQFLFASTTFAGMKEDLAKKVTDLAFRAKVESGMEQRFWSATKDWIKSKNPEMTSDQLVILRNVGKTEIPGAYEYAITPAYEIIGSKMSEAEMKEFLEKFKPETKAAFKGTALGQKFGKEVVPAFSAAMGGPVGKLMVKRLGNYRVEVHHQAIKKGFVPKP